MCSMFLTRAKIFSWARALLCIVFLCAISSLATAQTQSSTNRSRRFGPDACGPTDPNYIRMANETGGQPMFLQPSEAAKAFHLIAESTRNNMGTVLWATGALEGREQTFAVPVDSATKRITFSLSVDTKGTGLTLTQPSGGAIVEVTASTQVTELNCGRIVTVSAPETGVWHAKIAGTGRFWIKVQAESDIYFITAEFVKKGGRLGHESLFKIPGQPLAGIPATLDVLLSAKETKTVEFGLVTDRGDTIQELRMHAMNADRDFLEFVGSLELPKQPFRVAVTGRDSNGQSYQRFFSSLFHAETIELLPDRVPDELPVGNVTPVTFTLRNIGPPSTFKITVTDGHQFVSRVRPRELTLGTGESGTVRVELTVPVGTTPGVGDDVVMVATSTAGSTTSNSSVQHLSISASSATQNPR
jgi:von Willebrand factor A domain-containing protein 7